jgi:hypothetical protein
MHLEQMPDMGATSLDRLNVSVDSSAFGLRKFILTHLFEFLNKFTHCIYNPLLNIQKTAFLEINFFTPYIPAECLQFLVKKRLLPENRKGGISIY